MRDYENFLLANKQVAEIFNTLNDKKGIAENFEIIGDMYEKRYDEEKARVNYEKSRNIYEELGYKRNIAYNILKLAKVIDESDWRESQIKQRELYETALELYRNLGDKSGVAKTLTLLGSGWYFEIFRFGNDKNIEYLLEAIEIYHELNDINNLAINYSRVASSYQSSNELSKTIHSLNNAIKYFEISDLDEKSYKIKNCNNKLIQTYIKLSNKEQALELIQERNNYHKDNKDSLAIVQDYLTISKLYY